MSDNNIRDMYSKRVQQTDSNAKDSGTDMGSAEDALAAIGISVSEAIEGDSSLLRSAGSRDKSICVCGHPVSRHTDTHGAVYCKPTRMECPCKKVRPVLEAEDLRCFLRKTAGSGSMHALTRGMAASAQKEKKVRWAIDLKCDRCKTEASRLVPAPVTQTGFATHHPTGYDALLCEKCLAEI